MNYITELTAHEQLRQRDTLNLIASENYASPKVLDLLGSVWSNKYAEGYPGKRYYAGNENADELEAFVQAKALEVFDPTGEYGVNVQPLSGSPANAMVFLSVLEAGDTVMSLNLASGGHLSHLHATSSYLKFFKLVNYEVKAGERGFEIDTEDFEAKLAQHKPRLVILGFSAYPRAYEFEALIKRAHDHGALVLADIAHIAGLVAAGKHDTPFKTGDAGADFITMTTHKTLRGPRGALIFAKKPLIEIINKTVFPGTSGGPHLHQIAATGQALLELLGEDIYPDRMPFATYIDNVLATCRALEAGLAASGLEIVSPTQTHLTLVRLPESSDSLEVQRRLERAGIVTNRNQIPFDPKTAWRPSGLRLGTAALASRGLSEQQAKQLGNLIGELAQNEAIEGRVKVFVKNLAGQLSWWY
jgi:glycine hydroxymethyltransferase